MQARDINASIGIGVSMAALAVAAFALPALSIPVAVASAAAALWWTRNRPVDAAPRPAARDGVFLLGHDMADGSEYRMDSDDVRRHIVMFGTTGSGKSEAMLGFCANAMSWDSGLVMVDGKGDVSTFAKLYALARSFGREDDVLVLNMMTGGGVPDRNQFLSNTMNPFAGGSADALAQMVVSMMDECGSEGAMWKGRATSMLKGVMRALVWMRDEETLTLDVGVVRDHLNLRKIIDLANPDKFPTIPRSVRDSIASYLESLPGYQIGGYAEGEEVKDAEAFGDLFDDEHPDSSQSIRELLSELLSEPGNAYRQPHVTLDQHGYLEMQFTKILGSLADVYSHVFSGALSEVDMTDVVLNRRILLVMLPALERSGDEVANLGKIVLADLKRAMGFTSGNKVEGEFLRVVSRRSGNGRPIMGLFDEVGYYAVDGMDLMASQARSLGFSMVYAAQDMNGMKRMNDKIIGNVDTKIVMRIEDTKTAEMATELAGKAYRMKSGGAFDDRFEEFDRISFEEISRQSEGEMFVIRGQRIDRVQALHLDPLSGCDAKKLRLRANQFVRIIPDDKSAA